MNVYPFDFHRRRRANTDDEDPPRPGGASMRLPITEDQDPATAGSLFAENLRGGRRDSHAA